VNIWLCGTIRPMKNNNYFERFKKISKADWIIIGLMSAAVIFALYMSISFSVTLSNGLTLFGDSAKYTNDAVEISGPTNADISVLILFWVLTILVLALDVFYLFFKKIDDKKVVKKEIVDGRTVIISEEKDTSHAEK